MQCPRCQLENPTGSNFCLGCGRRLGTTCPACGADLPAGSRFCNKCGTPVGGQSAGQERYASPESYTPKHLAERIINSKAALEGERKQVTVLFADLKGSMELLADRDPEEARRLLDPVLEHMMEAVHRYEGTVNQVMGDGIMALFGAPLAHEDHAVRACYAALRMQESVKRYAESVRREEGITVRIRVGLNSGEVVVRAIGSDLHIDYTAVGQTTHLAARMEQLADPGTILLPAATLALAEDFVQVRPQGPTPVKGLNEPVEVYELTGAIAVRSRFQAHAARGLTTFVGRTTEIAQLVEALDLTRNGRGQVVAVIGEPGVGKSRLFWEFCHSHRTDGCLVLESASVSYGKATTYLPVIELLRGYFQIEPRDDPRKICEKITGKLLSLDRALEVLLPPLFSLLDVSVEDADWARLDAPQRRRRTLDALKRLLLRECQVQPLVLVFEDLHWIDGETQALLDALVESLPTARQLLLLNYRPEYRHAWSGKTYYRQLRIDPLSPVGAKDFLHALLGNDPSLDRLERLLIERTEGNPFFLEESVRTLVETKVLVGEPCSYRLTRPPESLQIPATAQAIVAARIDRLEFEDKRLLQTASVLGKDVQLALLEAIADTREDDLRQRLDRLQTSEFLYETKLFPEAEYTFKHALTHEVTYGGLVQERRRVLHARTVGAIETLHRDRLAEHVERLAHHALQGQLREKAVHYLREAGLKAAGRSAHSEAISHIRQGLDVLMTFPETPERIQQEFMLYSSLGASLIAIKGWAAPDVGEAYGHARELAQQTGESPQLFRALWGLWAFYIVRAEHNAARELGEQLLRLARSFQDDPGYLVEAEHALGQVLYCMGEFAAAQEHFERSSGLYNPGEHHSRALLSGADTGVFCLSWLSHTLWHLGYPDRALARMDEAIALAQKLAHPFSVALALDYAAMLHQFRREPQLVYERAESARRLSVEQGFEYYQVWATTLQGWALAAQGEKKTGLARMRQGLAAIQATGASIRVPYYLALLATSCADAGEPAEGLELLAMAAAQEHKSRESWTEAELYRVRGELLLSVSAEKYEEAQRCFHRALEVARRQQAKSLELRAATSLSRLWQQEGRCGEARQLLAPIYSWFTEGFDTVDLQEAKRALEDQR